MHKCDRGMTAVLIVTETDRIALIRKNFPQLTLLEQTLNRTSTGQRGVELYA